MHDLSRILAFSAQKLISEGPVADVAIRLKAYVKQNDIGNILIFDGITGQQVDVNWQGTEADIRLRYGASSESESAGPPNLKISRGRPKLGVTGREVTLLPRHWQWLDRQRGGASAALRRLVDQERKDGVEQDEIRQAQDITNRFIYAIAGDLQGFEEAVRALYAGDKQRFDAEIRHWPPDIRACAKRFSLPALQ